MQPQNFPTITEHSQLVILRLKVKLKVCTAN